MKTMTCRQLGGPCDLAHRGETHDDVINAQDQHLKRAEKDHEMGKDEHHTLSTKVQDLTDKIIKEIDEALASKEAEIMQV